MMARGGPRWSVALLQQGFRTSASRVRLSQHAGLPRAAPPPADLPLPRHLRSVSHEPMQFSTKASLDVGMASALPLPTRTEKLPTSRSDHVLYLRRGEGCGSFVFLLCRATNEEI